MNTPLSLRAALGDYPHTLPLKRREITSPAVTLDFADIKPVTKAFKPMVREQAFHVSEMALVTFFQALAYDKPLILLPATMMGRFQHGSMLYNTARGALKPSGLEGRRVGVRTYSQTTGVWLRGILEQEYGVDPRTVKWVTFEDAHVAEYHDPEGVERASGKQTLTEMLLNGEIDAAIYGADMPMDDRLQSVIPDPDNAARIWFEKHGVVPVNHMTVVTQTLAKENPAAVSEILRMLVKGKRSAGLPSNKGPDTIPFGFDAIKPAMQMLSSFAMNQGLLPRPISVDEIARSSAKFEIALR